MEKSDVRNILDGRTHCRLVWRKILFVSLVKDRHGLLLTFLSFVIEIF
jgi:hypothetical protein